MGQKDRPDLLAIIRSTVVQSGLIGTYSSSELFEDEACRWKLLTFVLKRGFDLYALTNSVSGTLQHYTEKHNKILSGM